MNPPAWLQLVSDAPLDMGVVSDRPGAGEQEVINLALQRQVAVVLMDESKGRNLCQTAGLKVIGTLGILERSARLRLIDLRDALEKLDGTNFRLSAQLRDAALRRVMGEI